MFQAIEPVAICDQFRFLFRRHPECEIVGEPLRIPPHLLIEPPRRHAIDVRNTPFSRVAIRRGTCLPAAGPGYSMDQLHAVRGAPTSRQARKANSAVNARRHPPTAP